ncbi:hypothetical protein [Natrarchaeobius halalkaliphilus]|uniref:hypothetical protein n=1 Tax=Natrarchaeobius halalkaliphilus TaxID=1679091 RepID=UPI000F5299B3|nr:hypothetical protein [Natrarchaeobius halalkaliphilus]
MEDHRNLYYALSPMFTKIWGFMTSARNIPNLTIRLFEYSEDLAAHSTVYNDISPKVYNVIRRIGSERCDQSIKPYKLLYIDPEEVSEFTRRRRPISRTGFGVIKGGDWDIRNKQQFGTSYPEPMEEYFNQVYPSTEYNDYVFYKSLEKHFIEGVEWKNTEYIEICLHHLDKYSGPIWHGCKTENEIYERASYVDELYDKIKSDGFKPYHELEPKRLPKSRANEVTVDIGRNGDFLFVDGRHRFSIARLIGIDRIPVAVLVRHEKWMETRKQYKKGEIKSDHPDFEALRP